MTGPAPIRLTSGRLTSGAKQAETTIIVPAFNEEEGLALVLEKLLPALDESCEVIVVDDGSTDATCAVASRYDVRVVSHSRNLGKAEAMRTGIREATGENVIFIDADDTYPAESVFAMVRALRKYEMVVGSRQTGHSNIPAFNRIGNAIFRNSIRYFYGFKPYDPLTGFYGIRKEYLERMQLKSQGFRIESEIAIKAARMGLIMLDAPIEYRPRVGEAKLRGLRDGYTIFETIVKMLFLYSPTLSLVLPGLALLLAASASNVLLLSGDVKIIGLRFGLQTQIFAAIGSLAAWNLLAAGLVLNLYGVAHKYVRPDFTARLFSRGPGRIAFGLLGACLLGGSALAIVLASPIVGYFSLETPHFVLAASGCVLGFQILVSAGLLSIIAGDLTKAAEG